MKFYIFTIAICVITGASDYLYPGFFHDPVRTIAMIAWSIAVDLPLSVVLGLFDPNKWSTAKKLWTLFNGYWYVFGLAHFYMPILQTKDAGFAWSGIFYIIVGIALTWFSIRYRHLAR